MTRDTLRPAPLIALLLAVGLGGCQQTPQGPARDRAVEVSAACLSGVSEFDAYARCWHAVLEATVACRRGEGIDRCRSVGEAVEQARIGVSRRLLSPQEGLDAILAVAASALPLDPTATPPSRSASTVPAGGDPPIAAPTPGLSAGGLKAPEVPSGGVRARAADVEAIPDPASGVTLPTPQPARGIRR